MKTKAVIFALFLLLAAGCTVGPDYHPPVSDTPVQWSGKLPDSIASQNERIGEWWKLFHDAELDSLIKRAVMANFDLRIAESRVRQARAQQGFAEADFWPTVNASGSYARQKQSENQPILGSLPKSSDIPFENDVYKAGFDASWEIDIFGGKSRAMEAATAELTATEYGRRDVLVSLLSEVTRYYDDMDSSPPLTVSQCTRKFKRDKEESEMNRNVVGLDSAKQVFHLFMMLDGKAIKRKLKRSELLAFIAQLPPSLIALEACGGSHHWARSFQQLGHEVKLLNARYVKAFVVGNKNDFNDAEAIFTAARQPNKRTVTIKNMEQQDLTMVHGIRQGKVEERTALINQIRGHLAERGIVLPKSANQVRKQLPSILEDAENQLSTLSRSLFAEQYEALVAFDDAIKALDRQIEALCRQNALSKRLVAIPGIGPLTATLAAADIGDGKGYTSSRDYAASLGVVPRQHSSGDRQVLLGISKRGNRRLRTLLIHGARAVLKYCGDKSDPLSRWLQALIERRGFNKAAVALANKNARIIWALATGSGEYVAQVA